MTDLPIDQLNLSIRAKNALRRKGIITLEQIMEQSEADLQQIRNMGAKSVGEVLGLQALYRSNPDAFSQYAVSAGTASAPDTAHQTMLNKAVPETLTKTVQKVYFRDDSGVPRSDIPVLSLGLSVRASNAIQRVGIKSISEYAFMEYDTVKEIKNLGASSLEELLKCIADRADPVYEGETYNKTTDSLVELIFERIESDKTGYDAGFLRRPLETVLFNNRESLKYESEDELIQALTSDALKNVIVNSDEIKAAIADKLLYKISETQNPVLLSTLSDELPACLYPGETVPAALKLLEEEKKIEACEGGYRLRLPNIKDWLEMLKDNSKQAVSLRIQGKTLDECGQTMGVTRERVRQIVSKEAKKKPVLREDDYAYWYQEYDVDMEAMQLIFGVTPEEYFYLGAIYNRGKKDIDDIPSDSHITQRIAVNYQKYSNRNDILFEGEYVPVKREVLWRRLAKSICSEEEMSYDDFYVAYLRMLESYGLQDNKKLQFPSERAMEARMQDSMYVLAKYGRKMRYYPINEYDVEELVSEMHLEQFVDVEVSADKLCDDNPELMEEYDIRDGYELHNLLNKTSDIWNRDGKYDVKLIRMPFMCFGNADRAKQTEELLYQIAPVTLEEFGQFYEMEYGVKANTAMANMTPFINKYYHDGYFRVDQPQLTDEEREYMAGCLTEYFYFVTDVMDIYAKRFGKEHISHMNPRSYKELGYKVFTNYLISDRYSSAEEYFRTMLLEKDVLDLNTWDSRIIYVQTANQALTNLRTNYELIEYEDKKYIRFEHFKNVAGDIDKDDFRRYVDEAVEAAGDEQFYTIKSLKAAGFQSRLHELGFGYWFNAAILKNSQKVPYIKTNTCIIFGNVKANRRITLLDFISYVMSRERKMDIMDFISYIQDKYGVTLRKDKITWLIKDSSIYFDPIMEKLYFDKEDYYNEF